MSYGGLQPCPRCGKLLRPGEACANCAAYSARYGFQTSQGYPGYPVTAQPSPTRWLLLLGTVLLLALLVWAIAPRPASSPVLSSARSAVAPEPVSATPIPPSGQPPDLRYNDLTPEQEAAFWRRKRQRDLEQAGRYVPTAEERAYLEARRWQDKSSLSSQSRTADYYLRRPELTRP